MGPSNRHDKRKRAAEFDPAIPPVVNTERIMVTTRSAAKEAQAKQVVLEQMTEIAASQPGVLEGYTLDPKLAVIVKRLSGYLQPVVTLMATMVPPTEESKIREKRG